MAKSKLVCNLNLDDFFTLPGSSEVWRRKSKDPVYIVDYTGNNPKRRKAYECVSLYDSTKQVTLNGSERVQLVDE